MKKVVSLLAVLFLFAGLVSAADNVKGLGTYKGEVNFTGAGYFEFDFVLSGGGTTISWSTSTIATSSAPTTLTVFNETGYDAWAVADQYATVKAKGSKANFYVYMYQSNKEGSDYKATTPRTNADGEQVYSGLVNKGTGGGEYRGYVPLAFSLVPSQKAAKTDGHVYDITFDGVEGVPTDDRANRFFLDKSNSKFKQNYTIIAAGNCYGPVFGPFDKDGNLAPWTSNKIQNNTAYMYFFGNFKNIQDGDVFGTDKINIQTEIQ